MAGGHEGILPGIVRNNQEGVSDKEDSMSRDVRRGLKSLAAMTSSQGNGMTSGFRQAGM